MRSYAVSRHIPGFLPLALQISSMTGGSQAILAGLANYLIGWGIGLVLLETMIATEKKPEVWRCAI
jgi:hypothetical protein